MNNTRGKVVKKMISLYFAPCNELTFEIVHLITRQGDKKKRRKHYGLPISFTTVKVATSRCRIYMLMVVMAVIILIVVKSKDDSDYSRAQDKFPEVLLGSDGVYSTEDFNKSLTGRSAIYWNDLFQEQDNNDATVIPHWGPCYQPKQRLEEEEWIKLMESRKERKSSNGAEYPLSQYMGELSGITSSEEREAYNKDLSGLCRPGFLIIGVGKCGTSSLYQYLVGHSRVLPASEKQVHYFKYYTTRPMKWYLSHFPSTQSFLSSGALMTGEASPGYIPYPDVAVRLKTMMALNAGDGHDPLDDHAPALIAIGRDPLDRAYSSYKYSYVEPTLTMLRKGKKHTVPRNQSDEYYADYIFSFEDLMEAELRHLKECLKPGGIGETSAKKFHTESWAVEEFERREREGLPPMVDIQNSCYGKRESKTIPRLQWKELIEENPDKIIDVRNLPLVESFIGDGLYALPLDWYYTLFPDKDIYFVCTEDLKQYPATTMSNVSDFLGLPSFNFTSVVQKGVYNARSKPGYEAKSTWTEGIKDYDIPISDNLKKEVLLFLKPYNERLFALINKECDWM